MRKKPLVKLGFAVLVATATMFGMDPSPARALSCPRGYGSCVLDSMAFEDGQCCCYYVNVDDPETICPNWCS